MITELPDLDGTYDVAPSAVKELNENGHAVLRGVASEAEIAAWLPVIREVTEANATHYGPLEERGTFDKMFLQIQNLWRLDERMRRFSLAKRFGQVAADLLGVDGVRMYHDQSLFKEVGGGPTPFHQDHYYFPLDGAEVVTMWMPLVPVTADMGSLRFVSGSHTKGFLEEFLIGEEATDTAPELIEDLGLPIETHGALAPGDATYHCSWVVHGAPANPTSDLRAVMTVIYFADGLRGIEPEHEWHQNDYAKWMPDVRPGELAAGEYNPLIWSRS